MTEKATPQGTIEGKPKRLVGQSSYAPPKGAKPEMDSVFCNRWLVPVSSVAREWGISPRRVRSMLAEGRLIGQQSANGYWQVWYPYSYVIGTRGPQTQREINRPKKSKKQEWIPDW